MKRILLTLLVLAFSGAAIAGDAGCGLGSLIIQRNSKLLQLFAITTNASFLSQPFGITSGTSNCSASGIVMNDKQMEYFVEVNQQDLNREMAQGDGEKLKVLAQLSGCASPEMMAAFAKMTQKSFSSIVTGPEVSPNAVIANLRGEMARQGICTVASR